MKPILEIQNISKTFQIHHERQSYLSLRDSISSIFKKGNSSDEEFYALDNVSFDVFSGDSIGIIGKNGAGKSTLLKILSKITPPTSGKIISRGRIASLLEVGTGFHAELSGRENIFLNGSILGMKRTEIQKNFDAIVDFSGVEKFLDTPLKHHSSGMQLRLAFAVAAFLENEILIIDEVLAVGDAEFQKKCMGKMEDVSKNQGRTVLFVSHNLAAMNLLCDKAVLIKNGKLVKTGDTKSVIHSYLHQTKEIGIYQGAVNTKKQIFVNKLYTSRNNSSEFYSEFLISEKIQINIEVKLNEPIKNFFIGVAVLDSQKNKIFTNHFQILENNKEELVLSMVIPDKTFTPLNFSLDVAAFIPNSILFDYVQDVCEFTVIDDGSEFYQDKNYGNVFINCSWVQQ